MSKDKKVDGRSREARQEALARPDEMQDMYLSPNRQCTAMSKIHGRQCQNRAMVGQRTCRMHGGATRQARAKAAERISQAQNEAADLLVEFMADPTIDVQLRTKIAQDLLDRSGVNTKTILELQPKPMSLFEQAILSATVEVDDQGRKTGPAFEQGEDGNWRAVNPSAIMTGDVFMDLDVEGEDIVDAEVVEEDDDARLQREDERLERKRELERMTGRTRTPSVTNDDRARQEADIVRAHAAGELGDDDLPPEQAARRAPVRRSSTADPYADRYEDRRSRRSMSPKRWEARQAERDKG